MSSELMPWHKNWLVDIDYNRVDFVKEGANSQAHIKLFKSRGESQMDLNELLAKMKPEHAAQIQVVLKAKDETITQLTTDLENAQEVTKAAPVVAQTEEEILKSIKDPAVKAILETQIAKARAAEDIAKTLKDAQDEKEAIEKAKEVTGLGAEESQLAQVYKSLKAVNPEVCETVFGIFKTASALIAEGGTLSEVGKSAGTEGSVGDENAIWGKIEAAAEEVAKSTNVSKARAISQVISENPDLYAQYLQAQKG